MHSQLHGPFLLCVLSTCAHLQSGPSTLIQSPTVCPSISSLLSLPANVLVSLYVALSHPHTRPHWGHPLHHPVSKKQPDPLVHNIIYYRPSRLHLTDSQPLIHLLLPHVEVETSGNQFNKVPDRQLVPGASQGGSREPFQLAWWTAGLRENPVSCSRQGKEYFPSALTGRVHICPKRKGWRSGGDCTGKYPAFSAGPPLAVCPWVRH